jgi:hypothetical protein
VVKQVGGGQVLCDKWCLLATFLRGKAQDTRSSQSQEVPNCWVLPWVRLPHSLYMRPDTSNIGQHDGNVPVRDVEFFFLNPHGRYGRGVERAKIKIISSSGVSFCRAETVLSRTQRSHRTQVMQPSTVTLLRTSWLQVCVCARARSPAGLLGNTGYLTLVAGRRSRKKIRWFPRSQSDERDTWH